MRVVHETHVGLKLPAALTSALAAGERPPVDVVWCNSVPALLAAERGDCLPLRKADMPVLSELARRAWPDGAPVDATATPVVHPYVVYYVLAYHDEVVSQPLTSWRDLLDPRFRGKLALYPGGNGFYPIAQMLGGGRVEDIPSDMTACWSFFEELRSQVSELDYSIGMEERLRRKDLHLCFRALTNALAFRAAGVPISWCIPKEGTTDTVDALWIPKGTPQAELAREYVAFALRPDVQEAWCELLGAMPVHPRAAVPSALRDRADLPSNADDVRGILHVPESLKVKHEHEWEARFGAVFVR
ncbi:Spermidine/putrescine-binding periplasmic protein [Labilithrix luteola]|uniref:Spermidine/putrescine-binding periplasmic protein n=1 Tax=Labilithrix luteola TaxID=1391654 RepID=A0A0K1PW53_9BACT|nr:Spermidine/putrescine-binding periplasmic protein [Labilithrix luteola]